MNSALSVLGRLFALVDLLSYVHEVSHTVYTGIHMVPTEEEFNLVDSDNDAKVSRYEHVEPFLKKAEL
ncbi:MAG: hypothetical protein F4Z66_01705 [Gammaproteobacteria bacterium]|nr:hypothetical protein [Gammaproteobacteria bacterium]